jgi:hypothetical protein
MIVRQIGCGMMRRHRDHELEIEVEVEKRDYEIVDA